ncbi:hypothetical protein AMTR_s00019p00135210 [Amborella trichopoda]|uniref:Cytochrome c oxidase subunit n=1 Tax=Amborella trichopoda TaxID=13333 RepID=W1PJ65_AMBTC|nr:hypothetical protein AMTR_s00019p00135210 [Amborella trichopoda]
MAEVEVDIGSIITVGDIKTAPADFRFPTTNQTRHCFTRYVEYHKCMTAKGADSGECNKFAKYYRSLCPGEWSLILAVGVVYLLTSGFK